MDAVCRIPAPQTHLKLEKLIENVFLQLGVAYVHNGFVPLSFQSEEVIFEVLNFLHFLPIFNELASEDVLDLEERR